MDYKKKYKKLKKLVKDQVFTNAALYDELMAMEQQLISLKNDRKYLLKRLFTHLPMTEAQVLQSTKALNAVASSHPGKIPPSMLSPVQPGTEKEILNVKKRKTSTLSSQAQQQASPTKNLEKPKRKKPGSVKKKVQALHMNELNVPYFPITLGTLTIHDLGKINPEKPSFHSERYIWPVGYFSTRLYPSMINPDNRIQYFCYIKDSGGDPIFQIIAEDEPDMPIVAVTASACHCIVLKRLNQARGKEATNTGSGPEFFGFSHSTIQYLIQCLPGADRCDKYVQQKFDLPAPPSSSTETNTIHEENLPNMAHYDSSSLELPEPKRKP